MKEIKAWAVVTRRGKFVFHAGNPAVYRTRFHAKRARDTYTGERVVRVTIIVEE